MKERHLLYLRDDVAYLLPDPGQFRDERLQLAVSLRNEATISGRCPVCAAAGFNRAERRRLARQYRGQMAPPQVFAHEPECPCSDDRLRELLLECGEIPA